MKAGALVRTRRPVTEVASGSAGPGLVQKRGVNVALTAEPSVVLAPNVTLART